MQSELFALFIWICSLLSACTVASPLARPTTVRSLRRIEIDGLLQRRSPTRVQLVDTTPTFPPSPPSCPICAQHYSSINSCAQAAPAFANFSQIIYAPFEFIDLIKCACTDTFQSAFPQCVDCFQQTNQTALIAPASANLPSIISGMRSVCALASTLLGNVTGHNGEQVNGTPIAVPMTAGAIATGSVPLPVLLLNVSMFLAIALASSALLWRQH